MKAGLLLTGLEKCLKSTLMTLKNQFQLVIATLKVNYEKAVSRMKDLPSQEIKVSSFNCNLCLLMVSSVAKFPSVGEIPSSSWDNKYNVWYPVSQ